jgi:hypothetical protein
MTVKTFAESGCTPKEYRNYLLGQITWANGILDQPAARWPAGSSHDIARKVLNTAHCHASDLIIEHGLFSANGALVTFQDSE